MVANNGKWLKVSGAIATVALGAGLAIYYGGSGNNAKDEAASTSQPDQAAEQQTAAVETASEPYKLTLDESKPGIAISPTLYGAFFEDINHAGDGGLYAEMLMNRSFENADLSAESWLLYTSGDGEGSIEITKDNLLNKAQKQALAVKVDSTAHNGWVGATNGGFWGLSVTKGKSYKVSFYAKASSDFNGKLRVSLEDAGHTVTYAEQTTEALSNDWKLYTLTLTPDTDDTGAYFVISANTTGTFALDVVSMFPDTWNNRENGMRADLAQMVADMKPSFLRFPGGCFIEGATQEDAYYWKETIGPVEERPGHNNLWGYRTTDGLGFHEFLQWSEDMGAEPLYVTNVGISHDGNPYTDYSTTPIDELGVWIQDALDAIEYANGPVTSKWGAERAKNGHPEPFNLKYIEVGNENNFQMSEYVQRYPLFYKAIKEKYPEITVISNADNAGEKVEMVDEHYYFAPQWFMNNADKYDSYDRSGPDIYVGEYAVTIDAGTGNMAAALGEAAFMTGMERNSDIVKMASYAPLFVNVNDRKWNPDAIVFDHATSYGTPSYYVQMLFGQNKGDTLIPGTLTGGPKAEPAPISGGVGVGTWATQVEYDDIKVTSADGKNVLLEDSFNQDSGAWQTMNGDWAVQDGSYVQSSDQTDVRATAGDVDWSNYTMTTRARKTGGAEGMLIMFAVKDSDNYYWWNLGGWGNTKSAIEKSESGSKSQLGEEWPLRINDGQWYNIRVEVSGRTIRCYLDDQLIHEVTEEPDAGPIFHVSGIDKETGDTIIKLVNTSEKQQTMHIDIAGTQSPIADTADVTTLKADSLDAENSLMEPTLIAPVTSVLSNVGESFDYALEPYSITVFRLHPKK
ncbi:alpha-L-arabinofuranosidase [Paenibacillus cellulosilyticus]|uniref:non-reducing end alpha-L-arabinofuranosidase n=1 Tax=Paenibacillus cellulosilyticus TaxID=375489 RepID=A0A2V2YGU8_9BACL|nr:alpha-L-arabinofuranosidase C-terminal domain-containing protein [Paenibacillus cellulosilyticus]PWV92103.1 alpha-L-arabinofuranosidase [Paenibacillus cellulosilyticus]QKS44213.1 carbohydrate binding domain-containing protein [Paenibacillus cellulosilyticus]